MPSFHSQIAKESILGASVCCHERWRMTGDSKFCPPALAISKWYGRAGNNLAQLTAALTIANATKSVLLAPPHELFGMTKDEQVWDFRSKDCVAYQEEHPVTFSSVFFFRSQCKAVGLDHMSLRDRRRTTTTLIAPKMPSLSLTPALDRRLVIHIRGGDVFQNAGSGRVKWYAQPPLAMYQRILTDGGYLTDRWPVLVLYEDDRNPVVDALKSWLSTASAEVQFTNGTGIEQVVSTLVGATHLVTAVSTLSLYFGLLGATNLQRVFIPFCRLYLPMHHLYDDGDYVSSRKNPRMGVNMTETKRAARGYLHDLRVAGGQADVGVPGFCYEFPEYDLEGQWMGTSNQIQTMLEYPVARLTAYSLPAGPGSPTVTMK